MRVVERQGPVPYSAVWMGSKPRQGERCLFVVVPGIDVDSEKA
jgi:hypothetical protein